MEMVLFLLHLLVFMLPEAFIYSKSMVLDYNRASPQIYWHTFIQILSSKSVCTSSLSTAGGAQDFRWEQGPAVVMVSGILETLDVNWWKERERERGVKLVVPSLLFCFMSVSLYLVPHVKTWQTSL